MVGFELLMQGRNFSVGPGHSWLCERFDGEEVVMWLMSSMMAWLKIEDGLIEDTFLKNGYVVNKTFCKHLAAMSVMDAGICLSVPNLWI